MQLGQVGRKCRDDKTVCSLTAWTDPETRLLLLDGSGDKIEGVDGERGVYTDRQHPATLGSEG